QLPPPGQGNRERSESAPFPQPVWPRDNKLRRESRQNLPDRSQPARVEPDLPPPGRREPATRLVQSGPGRPNYRPDPPRPNHSNAPLHRTPCCQNDNRQPPNKRPLPKDEENCAPRKL